MNRSPIGFLGRMGLPGQILVLALFALLVHSIYTLLVVPQAMLEVQQATAAGLPAPRSWWVIMKDPEQELCVFLFGWAIGLIAIRWQETSFQQGLLDRNYIPREENVMITPESALKYYRALKSLQDPAERQAVLPQMLITSLNHFNGTKDISSATGIAHKVSEIEADRMEAELSMVRYFAWAIPSVGFIGTVRGIGEAMSRAGEALDGNITGVTGALGVAFNSTLVALLLSIALMLLIHRLQMRQDRLIQGSTDYCHHYLLSHLGAKA